MTYSHVTEWKERLYVKVYVVPLCVRVVIGNGVYTICAYIL